MHNFFSVQQQKKIAGRYRAWFVSFIVLIGPGGLVPPIAWAADAVPASLTIPSIPALGRNGPLTLGSAQQLAVARSRQLVAKGYAVAAQRDMAVAARQLPDPVLRMGIDNVPVGGADRFSLTGDFMTMRRVGIMQELTRADKRQLRSAALERQADKLLAEKDVISTNVERDTALAWFDRYYAEAMANVLAEQGIQARMEIDAAGAAYKGGKGSLADVLAARSAFATYENQVSEARRRVDNATAMLERWIGPTGAARLGEKPATDQIGLDAATLEHDLGHHPEVAVLVKQEDIARTQERLAQANKQADWTVEVAFQQRGPSYSNMASVALSVPLQWDRRRRQDRELSASRAMVDQAKAEREEALRDHIVQTRAWIVEWHSNQERLARFDRELVPLSRERSEATVAAYRGGKASLSDVLGARRTEIDTRLQFLQLEADTARLWTQITFLIPKEHLIRPPAAPFSEINK